MYVTYLECKIFVEIGTTQDHASQHKGQSEVHAPAPGPPLPHGHSILRVLQSSRETVSTAPRAHRTQILQTQQIQTLYPSEMAMSALSQLFGNVFYLVKGKTDLFELRFRKTCTNSHF